MSLTKLTRTLIWLFNQCYAEQGGGERARTVDLRFPVQLKTAFQLGFNPKKVNIGQQDHNPQNSCYREPRFEANPCCVQ